MIDFVKTMDVKELLRRKIEEKVQSEWTKNWQTFGDYKEDKSNRRAKFYEALAADISKCSGNKISRDTVHRFCTNQGGDSLASLNALSKYIGFESYEGFRQQTFQQIEQEVQKLDVEVPIVIPKERNNRFLIWALGLGVLIAGGMSWMYFEGHNKAQNAFILKAIEDGNRVQFQLYYQMDLGDTVRLDSFYTHKGTARKAILTLMKRGVTNFRRINMPQDNPSYYKIFDKQVIEAEENRATVKTKEHWFLKWYNISTQRFEVSYDVQNEQIYELIKEQGHWKIDHNYYVGRATPINY